MKKLEYKRYYHVLLPTDKGLLCLGSNIPGHTDCTFLTQSYTNA